MNSKRNTLFIDIPDYFITLFFLIIGISFTVYVLLTVKSLNEFFKGFTNPLIYLLYYLWIKALVIDTQRIISKEKTNNYFPGFVYWIYAAQWIIYWMINDATYSQSQLRSITNNEPSLFTSLYFTNRQMFWFILESITAVIMYPVRIIFSQFKDTTIYVILDSFRYSFLLVIYSFLSLI